jgi:CRISPR system Cascade subunit CasC
LANAFETAVRVKKDESLTRKSAEELVKKARALQAAFDGEGKTYVLNLAGADINGLGMAVTTLKDLLDKTLSAAQE